MPLKVDEDKVDILEFYQLSTNYFPHTFDVACIPRCHKNNMEVTLMQASMPPPIQNIGARETQCNIEVLVSRCISCFDCNNGVLTINRNR